MQQQVSTSVSHMRKLVVYSTCCLVVIALWWVGNNTWTTSSVSVHELTLTGVPGIEDLSARAPIITRDGMTVYGGNYTVILMPARFVPNSDGQTAMLTLDLKYSNDSPFVTEIAPSNQLRARVFDDRGALVGSFVANQGVLQPGSIENATMSLGKNYSLQRSNGRQFWVLLSDAGGNLHGQSVVEMPKLY